MLDLAMGGVLHKAPIGDDPQRILADHPYFYVQNQIYLSMALASGAALYVTKGLSRRKFLGGLSAMVDADHSSNAGVEVSACDREPYAG